MILKKLIMGLGLSMVVHSFCNLLLAQNDLVVFSNDGSKFYLYVNGTKQNATPESNVRVSNIKQPWVKLKVVFEDNKKIPDLTTNVQFMWEAEEKKGWEFVYEIINRTGKYKIKPYSAAPITNEKSDGQMVVNYVSEDVPSNVSSTQAQTPAQVSQTVSTTTLVTSGVSANNPNSANVNISISPMGANVQIQEGSVSTSTYSGYTTTVVSTTVSSSVGSNSSTSSQQSTTSIRCAVSDKEFESIKKDISSKSFENSKLTLAKQVCSSKCLKSAQVRDNEVVFV
ncbi:MAG: DUF4476 domain-containing protein [Bacteroidia bacterium]|nr:DUF4476 domain-containing protein [Bacteroidia bacterium]